MAQDKMQVDDAPASAVNGVADGGADGAKQSEKATVSDRLNDIIALLEKSVKTKETRSVMGRLLRQTAVVRKQLNPQVLQTFLQTALPSTSESRTFLQSEIAKGADTMQTNEAMTDAAATESASTTPEVEMYTYLLVLLFIIDQKKFDQAKAIANKAVARLAAFNRRTLDVIAARIYFYYSWTYECTNTLEDIRSVLLGLHRTAVLRHDSVGQETLMNLLLRNYLHYHLYDQAEKFRSKAQKEDVFRSNQQYCRYLFYLGCIRTIQLEYTDAKDCLQQATRKAPSVAHGFRVASSKWLILVRLLLGEIPERQEFSQPGLGAALKPYFDLTQAVRSGDLVAFSQVAERHDALFRADNTRNLITRLHHNVIRTGLRRINLAYSRISLQDVAAKLHLASVEDAECIVAKAIRDGGIDAVLDHEGGFMSSKEVVDIYSTVEPQSAFHARIAFCLDLHNEAVRAMRFEPDAHKKKLETVLARRNRAVSEAEIAKAIAEEEDEDF